MTGLAALTIGAVLGAGVWLIGRGLVPRPLPLAAAMSGADRSASLEGSMLASLEALGIGVAGSDEDLRLVSRTRTQQAFNKVAAALTGAALPPLTVLGLAAVGLEVSPAWALGLAAIGCPIGFVFPDFRLREQARERRDTFRRALAAYLDLVRVLVAGGGHTDGALYQAALAGEGWQFDELRAAVDWSRVNGYPPHVGFERLASAIDVVDLAELAGSISLADEQGASPADALSRKAESLMIHEIAEARSRADAATEQMAVPTVLIAMAFVIFLGYPALSTVAGLT